MKVAWEEKPLGEVCNVKRGTTITKKQTIEGDIPVIGGGTKPTYFHNEPNREAHCITVSGSGASAGYVNMWSLPIFASDCSTVEPKDDLQHRKFIYYYLCSQQDYIYENFRSGAAQPHVYAKDIATLYFPILPIEEQQRIVEILDEAFAGLGTARANVSANLENSKELFQSLLDETLGEAEEKGWKTKPLGEICDFVRGPFGGSLKKNMFTESGYAVYEQQHAINNQCLEFRYFISKKKFDEMQRFEVRSGDILMSCSGTIGKTTIVSPNAPVGIINQALLKITPHEKLDVHYLKYFMSSALFSTQLMSTVDGAAIQNVASVKTLKEISIFVPPLAEQQRIVEKINSLHTQTDHLQQEYSAQLANLDDLRQSLLQKAFAGELT